ncbi:MAG: DUF389 domain-containing protein [Chloroflexaceae bacterium]|nr:DUF389 domain-containing protein [Chloroflexaceae bacterium]
MIQLDQAGSGGGIRSSRVMGLTQVIALGTCISVGLGVYTLQEAFVSFSQMSDAIRFYLVVSFFLLPILLSYAERAAVVMGGSGVLGVVRRHSALGLSYSIGWLLLGGYVCLIALLAWGTALHGSMLSVYLFHMLPDVVWLALPIIGLSALFNLLALPENWQSRSTHVYMCLGILAVVILLGLGYVFIDNPDTTATRLHLTSIDGEGFAKEPLTGVIASLWGILFLLNVRYQIQKPSRVILPSVLSIGGLTFVPGVLVVYVITQASPTVSSAPLVEIIARLNPVISDVPVTLYALAGVAINLIGLNLALVHGMRLIDSMVDAGFLPPFFDQITNKQDVPIASLTLIAVFSVFLLLLTSLPVIAELVALIFLGVTILLHLPDALSRQSTLPDNRRFKLPFYPLFPWLVIVISLFFGVFIGVQTWWPIGIWAGAGLLIYGFYARRQSATFYQQEVLVGEHATTLDDQASYRVMLSVSQRSTAGLLIQSAITLAQQRQGQLFLVKVLALPEQLPLSLQRQIAEQEWQALAALARQDAVAEVDIVTQVRLAPNPTSGILASIRENQIDLLLLGWPTETTLDPSDPRATEPFLERILRYAQCQVLIIKGMFPSQIQRILVPTAGGPYTAAAVELARNLISAEDGAIHMIHVITPTTDAEAITQAQAYLDQASGSDSAALPVTAHMLTAETVREGIVTEASQHDLVIMGASNESFMGRAFFGGLPVDVASTVTTPTMIMRSQENRKKSWIITLWELVSDNLPTLTVERRTEVYQAMQEAARPSVDFFVLITLAATIAILGLLQNSAAVIIGAMLVAPLMSPILAMGMGIVQGNIRMLGIAARATTQGIALAIAFGLLITMISPIQTATNEILGRTQPNLLDLLVALASGAAAGYALGRKEVAAALPGVAIAAALVPPLCVVGYGLGTSQLAMSAGALILFTTNLVAIVFSSALTFLALGFYPAWNEREQLKKGLSVTISSLVIITLLLTYTTLVTVNEANRQNRLNTLFTNQVETDSASIQEMTIRQDQTGYLIEATIVVFETSEVTPERLLDFEQTLSEEVHETVTIRATLIPGSQTSLAALSQQLTIEHLFQQAIVDQSAQVADLTFQAETASEQVLITATIITFPESQVTPDTLNTIQQQIHATTGITVSIQATIVPGQRVNLP